MLDTGSAASFPDFRAGKRIQTPQLRNVESRIKAEIHRDEQTEEPSLVLSEPRVDREPVCPPARWFRLRACLRRSVVKRSDGIHPIPFATESPNSAPLPRFPCHLSPSFPSLLLPFPLSFCSVRLSLLACETPPLPTRAGSGAGVVPGDAGVGGACGAQLFARSLVASHGNVARGGERGGRNLRRRGAQRRTTAERRASPRESEV